MSVRLRLALVVFLTGLLTCIGVIATLGVAFQRLEHERAYDRANTFLDRVLVNHADILELHERNPETFIPWLKNLLLFEPDTQLYLLRADGSVLASTGRMPLAPGFKVALQPVRDAVQAAATRTRAPYVMGDDPEHMNSGAVIAARELRRTVIRPQADAAGFLYVVVQPEPLPAIGGGRAEFFRSALAGPALAVVLGVVLLSTVLAAWLVITITRPLAALSDAVAKAARDGFREEAEAQTEQAGRAPQRRHDEFGRLQRGFQTLLDTLRAQWSQLLELDRFRREGVSNLSHDLRSPLTATAASLETLQQRWRHEPARAADLQLVEVALRNTRNAAGLVRSLGDLALLDEPSFRLEPMLLDVAEVLDDITLRFAERAERQGIALRHEAIGAETAAAHIDIELFERAVANLLDNALKFTPSGGHVTLTSQVDGTQVAVGVADSGSGIAAADMPRLFDRLYQARESTAPAAGDGGKGLGLAIVKRIAELHAGTVDVTSAPGRGTQVWIRLPRAV